MAKPKEIDICFSYAGEDAEFVAQVQKCIDNMEISTFNYKVRSVPLGENLEDTLKEIYQKRGTFCIVFFSKHYLEKVWTQKELAYIKRKLRKKHGRVIAVLLEEGTLPEEFKKYVYFDARTNRDAQLLAQLIAGRLIQYLRQAGINRWLAVAASVLLVAFLATQVDKIPSRTSVVMEKVKGSPALTVHATNAGWRQSELIDATLQFPGMPIVTAQLGAGGNRVIAGRKSVNIDLVVPGNELERPCLDGSRLTQKEIDDAFLRGKKVLWRVRIRENGIIGSKIVTPPGGELRASEIQDFLLANVPFHAAPCDEAPIPSDLVFTKGGS